MNIAICYESVVPARGGCETYIADLIRRLTADRHEVHLYASEWDAATLPGLRQFHRVPKATGPRFLRPWRFAARCEEMLARGRHDVSLGFVKTWGQDVIFPQGGLHVASAEFNIRKHRQPWKRALARIIKSCDLAHWSYCLLERRQFLRELEPLIVAPSRFVERHFQRYYGISPEHIRVVPNAIDPHRFPEHDRLRQRAELRRELGIDPADPVALFIGHNYLLKGLEPLLEAAAGVSTANFRLLVCGNARTSSHEKQARNLGIDDRVHFLGFRQDVRPCFFAADFLVHPTFYDPCSLVVLEALACGLPVITTWLNGAAELLHPPHDALVIDEPHDVRELTTCIEKFCDPAVRQPAAQAARRSAGAWTFEDHYRALLAVLKEAARRKQAA